MVKDVREVILEHVALECCRSQPIGIRRVLSSFVQYKTCNLYEIDTTRTLGETGLTGEDRAWNAIKGDC